MSLRALCLIAMFIISTDAVLDPDDSDKSVLEDSRLDFQHVVTKYGYPVEKHEVVTSDGYILTLYRIPYGRKCGREEERKPPVLLIHGLLSNSISWILTGPEKSLGYILADNCYDVWLGNTRGNCESRKHLFLSPESPAFWDFSWHEMGVYDIPAFIDHILKSSNASNLHYVGHSQGTTVFFVFNSFYPERSKQIRSFQALAPVAYMGHLKSPPARFSSKFVKLFEGFTKLFGPKEFLPSNEIFNALGREACRDRYPAIQSICSSIIFLTSGFDPEQLNTTLLPLITSRTASGSSTKQFIHYSQNINSGGFRQYDYSWLLNQVKYGSIYPPSYDLSKVLAPTALHYSRNDWFVDVRDVDRLASELPNLIGKFLVPYPKFNHIDFTWANDAKTLVYDRMMAVMEKY